MKTIETRHDRLARYLAQRQAAGYEDPCFEMFLWYPRPDGSWPIVIGDIQEYHKILWSRVAREQMARDWGLSESQIPGHFDPTLIPTGFVDFEPHRGRDVPYLTIPSELPPGWTPDMVRSRLRCGYKMRRINPSPSYNADPEMVEQYLRMFKRLQSGVPG